MGEDVADGKSSQPGYAWITARPAGQARDGLPDLIPDPILDPIPAPRRIAFLNAHTIACRKAIRTQCAPVLYIVYTVLHAFLHACKTAFGKAILPREKTRAFGHLKPIFPGSDFTYTKNLARPRSGTYLHNEIRAAGNRILYTQGILRGRDSDFSYTRKRNSAMKNGKSLRPLLSFGIEGVAYIFWNFHPA